MTLGIVLWIFIWMHYILPFWLVNKIKLNIIQRQHGAILELET